MEKNIAYYSTSSVSESDDKYNVVIRSIGSHSVKSSVSRLIIKGNPCQNDNNKPFYGVTKSPVNVFDERVKDCIIFIAFIYF